MRCSARKFARLYLGNGQVQVQLGAPVSAAVRSDGATQPFERGRMFYAAEAPPEARTEPRLPRRGGRRARRRRA
ncbi:MAG: hypothetical protein U0232_05510 [Thermomicrobiales bacterium]